MLRITTVANHSELLPYSYLIEELVSQQTYPIFYLRFPYIFSWLKTFEAEKNVLVILCFDKDVLVGFSPFLIVDKKAKNTSDDFLRYSGIVWKQGYKNAVFEACVTTLGQHAVEQLEIGPIHAHSIEAYQEYFHSMPNASLEALSGAPFLETNIDKKTYNVDDYKLSWTDKVSKRYRLRFNLNGAPQIIYRSPTALVYDQSMSGILYRNFMLGPDFRYRQGAISTRDPSRMLLDFTKNLFFGSFFVKDISSALFLGLGPGVVPMALQKLHANAVKIDAVDINPEVIKIATMFFDLDARINIFNADAALFVRQISKRYDYICVDIWNDKGVPEFLLEASFWQKIFEVLNDGGTVSLNAPKHLHQDFCDLISKYAVNFYSLAGNNTSLFVHSGDASLDMSNTALLDSYSSLGVDVKRIFRQATRSPLCAKH